MQKLIAVVLCEKESNHEYCSINSSNKLYCYKTNSQYLLPTTSMAIFAVATIEHNRTGTISPCFCKIKILFNHNNKNYY